MTEWWKRVQALSGKDGLTEIKVGYSLMKQRKVSDWVGKRFKKLFRNRKVLCKREKASRLGQ